MKEFVSSARDLSRNPLGIIGLFLVLVYGFAGIVTASPILENNQRQILIYFLVLFPELVLLVFYRLVTNHHNKLYSPSDYNNEENFMKALEIGISNSDKIGNLEMITEEISRKINEQPLYRYTELEEEGKLLILMANRDELINLKNFAKARDLDLEKLKLQSKILLDDYKWIKMIEDRIEITEKGKRELKTFEDFVFGRLS